MMEKTKLFPRLIEAEEVLVQPGGARAIQQMGFEAGISGARLSESPEYKP
jgi:hypothetical protein